MDIEATSCHRACCWSPFGVCRENYDCQHHTTDLAIARAKVEARATIAEMSRIWGSDGMGRK